MGRPIGALISTLALSIAAAGCSADEPASEPDPSPVAASTPTNPTAGAEAEPDTPTDEQSDECMHREGAQGDSASDEPASEVPLVPEWRMIEWLLLTDETTGGDLAGFLDGLVVERSGHNTLDTVEWLRRGARITLLEERPPAVRWSQTRVNRQKWTAILEDIDLLSAVVLAVGFSNQVGITALVHDDGSIAFVGDCRRDLYTSPLLTVAEERSVPPADVVVQLATGDEILQDDMNTAWVRLTDRRYIDWLELRPDLRLVSADWATVTLLGTEQTYRTPPDLVAELTETSIFLELSQRWPDERDVCLRQDDVGIAACTRAVPRGGTDRHVRLGVHVALDVPLEIWLAANSETAEWRHRRLGQELGRVPTVEDINAHDVRPDYALLATIEPEVLATLEADSAVVLDLDPDSDVDLAALTIVDPQDLSDEVYLPDRRTGPVLDLGAELSG